MNGFLITFEGGEGAGKGTQIVHLAGRLLDTGRTVSITREPGGTPLGATIRGALLRGGYVDARAETLLYLGDRAQHTATVIRPALERGNVVLCDRYADSTIAYQGTGRGLDVTELTRMTAFATGGLRPSVTVLLDIDPRVGLQRVRDRDPDGVDRIETEALAFHDRVRRGYLDLAARDPDRYIVVDASGSIDDVAAQIADHVLPRVAVSSMASRRR